MIVANLEYAIVRDVVNMAVGNQTFSSGDSWVAKAALFYMSFATADGVNTNHMVGGFGLAESTSKRGACTFTSEHGQPDSDTARGGSTSNCIVLSAANPTSTPDGLADFVSFGAGEVTVNWSNAPSAAFNITVVLLGGADLNVHYENVAISSTVNTATTVTPGFAVDAVIVGYFDDGMDGTIDSIWARTSFGAAVWNGSSFDQRCNFSESEDGRVTAAVNTRYSETYSGYSIGGNEAIDIDNRTSTTFDVSPRISGSGENCMVLALGLGGGSAKLGTYSTRTTVGTDTISTTFEPGLVMLGMSNISNIDVTNLDVDSTYGIAFFDNGGTVSSSIEWADEDGPTTTNTQSRTNTGIELVSPTGADNYIATPGTTVSAFTLNFSAVNGSADNWWYLAFEKGTVGGAALIIQNASHAHTADNLMLAQQNVLAIQDSAHAHLSDNLILTQANMLAIQSALHTHLSDNLALVPANVLTILNAIHTHAADSLTLSLSIIFSIENGAHTHTADSLALAQANALVIADVLHNHTADNLSLSLSTLLAIQDGMHTHIVDNLILTQVNVLAIQDALHTHLSDNMVLVQQNTLIIDDTLHALISDHVTLNIPSTAVTPQRRTYIIQRDGRVFVVLAENRTIVVH